MRAQIVSGVDVLSHVWSRMPRALNSLGRASKSLMKALNSSWRTLDPNTEREHHQNSFHITAVNCIKAQGVWDSSVLKCLGSGEGQSPSRATITRSFVVTHDTQPVHPTWSAFTMPLSALARRARVALLRHAACRYACRILTSKKQPWTLTWINSSACLSHSGSSLLSSLLLPY